MSKMTIVSLQNLGGDTLAHVLTTGNSIDIYPELVNALNTLDGEYTPEQAVAAIRAAGFTVVPLPFINSFVLDTAQPGPIREEATPLWSD